MVGDIVLAGVILWALFVFGIPILIFLGWCILIFLALGVAALILGLTWQVVSYPFRVVSGLCKKI